MLKQVVHMVTTVVKLSSKSFYLKYHKNLSKDALRWHDKGKVSNKSKALKSVFA